MASMCSSTLMQCCDVGLALRVPSVLSVQQDSSRSVAGAREIAAHYVRCDRELAIAMCHRQVQCTCPVCTLFVPCMCMTLHAFAGTVVLRLQSQAPGGSA
jgi:hypothetical protein